VRNTTSILRNHIAYLIAGLLVLVVPFSQANDASRISGFYQVIQKTDMGPQTRVRLQLRLTSHGKQELRIQRLTVWDFSHPHKGGTQPCTIVLGAGASVGTTQEFTIPRAEYEMWTRGTRPRLVVEVQSSRGHIAAEAVRLDHEFQAKAE